MAERINYVDLMNRRVGDGYDNEDKLDDLIKCRRYFADRLETVKEEAAKLERYIDEITTAQVVIGGILSRRNRADAANTPSHTRPPRSSPDHGPVPPPSKVPLMMLPKSVIIETVPFED